MIYVSIIMNVVFIVLVYFLVKRTLDLYSRVEESFLAMESFREHLDVVHNLDTFYGDVTLGALIEHSKELSDFLRDMQEERQMDPQEEEKIDYGNTEKEEEE